MSSPPTPKKRPAWLGLVLFLAAGCVFGLLVLVGLGFWIYSKRDVLADEAKQIGREARDYAKSANQEQCVDEAFRRRAKCFSLPCELRATLFVSECMRKATPSPEFCAQVPDPRNPVTMTAWSLKECTRRSHSMNDQTCARLLQTVARSCHPTH